MPVSGSKGYRSGIVTLPNRVRIREMDSRHGLYPTIARLGDHDNRGDVIANPFDDNEMIVFNPGVSNVMYGSLSKSGSAKSLEPYASPHDPNGGLSGVGSLIAGISDNTLLTDYKSLSSIKNDIENISPFTDSRISLLATGAFYMTGTAESTYPGFKEKLHNKTHIVIDMTSNEATDLGMCVQATNASPNVYYSDTSDTKQPAMAYYNPVLKRWEALGNGFSTNHYHQDSVGMEYVTNQMCLGFAGLLSKNQISTGSGYNDQVIHPDRLLMCAGRPVSSMGFPFSGKYHATSSQVIKMSDYISSPMLVEKVQFSFDAKLESGGSGLYKTYGQKPKSSPATLTDIHFRYHNFFILRQFKSEFEESWTIDRGEDPSTATQYHVTSSIPGYYTLASGSNVWSYIEDEREMMTYGQLVEFHVPDGDILDHGSNPTGLTSDIIRNSALIKNRDALLDRGEVFISDDDTPHSLTGSFNVNCNVRHSATMLAAGGPTVLGPLGTLFLENTNTSRGRNRLDKNARALVNGHKSLLKAGSVLVGARQASALPFRQETVDHATFDNHSPYILFPEDEIIIGYQYPLPYDIAFSGGPVQQGQATNKITFDGQGKLILFGSQIKNNREYHDTLNQNLTSEAIHEALTGGPVVDQFQINYRHEYSGGFLDTYSQSPGIGNAVQSIIGTGENVLSSSFQRFFRLQDNRNRYYDTLVPNIEEMAALHNKKPITAEQQFGREVKAISLGRGKMPDGTVGTMVYNGSGAIDSFDAKSTFSDNWHAIFPFEPKYDNVGRVLRQNMVFSSVYFPIHTSSIWDSVTFIDRPTVQAVYTRADQTTPLSYLYEGNCWKDMTWGYGTAGQGYFRAVENEGDLTVKTVGRIVDGVLDGSVNVYGTDDQKARLERAVGWKYGLMSPFAMYTYNIFRNDKFGQPADMLEQSPDSRYYFEDETVITEGPIQIKFVMYDENHGVDFYRRLSEREIGENTSESSNISVYATSSMPFFDDVDNPRNRIYTSIASRIIEIT